MFQYLPGKRACRLELQLDGPAITDTDKWGEVLAWMEDTQQRLREAVQKTGLAQRDTTGRLVTG